MCSRARLIPLRMQTAVATPTRTRGDLTVDFLASQEAPKDHLDRTVQAGDEYGGYNMVCADLGQQEAWLLSNRGDRSVSALEPGLHAISNGVPQDEWPKMRRGKAKLQPLLDRIAPDGALP